MTWLAWPKPIDWIVDVLGQSSKKQSGSDGFDAKSGERLVRRAAQSRVVKGTVELTEAEWGLVEELHLTAPNGTFQSRGNVVRFVSPPAVESTMIRRDGTVVVKASVHFRLLEQSNVSNQ